MLALGEGKPVTRIAKDEKCSPDTVMAIAKREKQSIDAENELTAGLTAYAAQACVMKLIEKLEADQIPVGVLPIETGILIDKARANSGEATAVIEHRIVSIRILDHSGLKYFYRDFYIGRIFQNYLQGLAVISSAAL